MSPAHAKSFGRIALLLAGILSLCTSAAAQTPIQPAPEPPIQIGVAAAVSGTVRVTSADAVGRIVDSGRPIFLGDVVTTDAQGRLQVMLLDETVFTIGPNSSIVIDEFVYDPRTADGKLTASVLKGTFRFVTGKIAHKRPEHMQVDLPVGTIGVRGTMVEGRVTGEESLVALRGPGPGNTVGARVGRIEVGNEVNDAFESVLVAEPGYGTTIPGRNLPPTMPEALPQDVLMSLDQALTMPAGEAAYEETPDQPAPGAHDGSEDSGEMHPPTIDQLEEMRDSGAITEEQFVEMAADLEAWNTGDEATRAALMEKYGGWDDHEYSYEDYYSYLMGFVDESHTAAQDAADYTASVTDGITTAAQLAQVQTGSFSYSGSGAFTQTKKDGLPVNYVGTMNVLLEIDFGSRTIGGGGSNLGVTTITAGGDISSGMAIPSMSLDAVGGSGLAEYTHSGGNLTGTFTLNNTGGVIAGSLDAEATYNNGLDVGSGKINDIPRQ
jgi:hypothetical protein